MAHTKRKRKYKKEKKEPSPSRLWSAVAAWFRRSGPMKDKKKEQSKKACRQKVNKDATS